MFTGLVTAIGTIGEITPQNLGLRLKIYAPYNSQLIAMGASIACNGICLTVTNKSKAGVPDSWFEVEAWQEAIDLTTIATWQIGTEINLEMSLKLGDEMGGHLVSGHIDGMATIEKIEDVGDARRFTFSTSAPLSRFIAPKGSVALDGTSLTVNHVDGQSFDVLIIRHTLDVTTWGHKKAKDVVNLEIDQLARYAARLLETR